ncbi:hypothetical protein [robinz microvirus RP_92]|nr:hypothetical protein [robinz microvirus RP_92]
MLLLVIYVRSDTVTPFVLLFEREFPMRRHSMSPGASKRSFTRHGSVTHRKNLQARVMRGGIRL